MKDEPICCPRLDPTLWDNKMFIWDNKRFVKAKVPTIFYMPIGFGRVMTKMQKKVAQSGAIMEDYLCLSDHTSKWNMNIYLAVDREIIDSDNVALSGNFYSKVYEGPFKDTEKWMNDFNEDMIAKNHDIKKIYMWYTTCPKCAKKYGKNYVVIIAQI